MSVTRDIAKVVLAVPEHYFFTCGMSTLVGSGSTAAGRVYQSTFVMSATLGATATCGITGHVIDRLGPELGANFTRADVYAYLHTCEGSETTPSTKKLAFGAILQQASASGGTFTDLSTENWPGLRYVLSSGGSTAQYSWTTDNIDYIPSHPWSVDIRPAKRFLRVTILAMKNNITTASCGLEVAKLGAMIAFREGDYLPFKANTTGAWSTSTSTST